MNINKNKTKTLTIYILFFTVLLGIVIFLYPVLKPIPPGSDANIYLNDAKWISVHETALNTYQPTYHGFYAYTAPITDLNIVLLSQFTGLNRIFPILSIYQLYLIILLILSGFLLGKIYNLTTAILTPIALLGSFAMIRLFIGSTISNLLALVFVNIIFYCISLYLKTKKSGILLLILVLCLSLFFTHNYLTAPIFIMTLLIYILFLILINENIRHAIIEKFKQYRVLHRFSLILIFIVPIILLYVFYHAVLLEAIRAFWRSGGVNKFIGPVKFSEYGSYLGNLLYIFGVLGLLVFLTKLKKNIVSFKVFPVIWFCVLLILLQTYRIGINFHYERIVFLAGAFIALFAAYFLSTTRRILVNGNYIILIFSLFIVLVVSSGTNRVRALFGSSNLVTKSQITALELIRNTSQENAVIYSHVNAVSQTNHDIMITDRDIIRLSTALRLCDKIDAACQAFNTPDNSFSVSFFKENNVKYFLFIKPSYEGNSILDALIKKYSSSSSFSELYAASDVFVYVIK